MLKKLLVLGAVVAAVGLMVSSCGFEPDGKAYIRFTWAMHLDNEIDFIEGGYEMIEWYKGLDDAPGQRYVKHTGSRELDRQLVNNNGSIFNRDNFNASPRTRGYYGRYFHIYPGSYTAICAILDEDGITPWADVIANYKISVVAGTTETAGTDSYFELAFDVERVMLLQDDLGWDLYNDGNNSDNRIKPRFKRPVLTEPIIVNREIVQGNKKIEVQYVLVPRNKTN